MNTQLKLLLEEMIIKENDEPKELYITVDGKEYHFNFKEE